MAILVGQLIEILKQFDPDREMERIQFKLKSMMIR